MSNRTPYVGLDIGTSKVAVVVATRDPSTGMIDIVGSGIAPCDGLKRGVVTNIGKTAEAINNAIEQAEKKSGFEITRAVVGVSGDHIATSGTKAIVTVSGAEITASDVRRLHHELAQVRITPDRRILHVIPQDYVIDDLEGITDPLGMSGKRVEANGLVITASAAAVDNIYRCAERAGVDVDALVLQPLASAYAVLEEAEKDLGIALVDIGAGTTDVSVFKGNVLRFASVVPVAGQKVTDDIMTVLSIRNLDAEQIKKDHGHADGRTIMHDTVFQIPGVAGRTPTELSKVVLAQIIEPRAAETFELVLQRLMDSGWAHQLNAGIVLTGGSSLLRGSDTLARRVFNMPVAIGIPRSISKDGLGKEVTSPAYSTAVGLALYALQHEDEFETPAEERETQQHPVAATQQHSGDQKGFLSKVKNWFENL
ncbi:MAG: cell division protein FtsA [Flavobacteriales bacterium]|nr:MAG: cell division protein FtsA [Chlorobi bacterium OLB6]MBE2266067.1 cell division protein FtsA [Flavobacteriales bacterium]MBV6464297.1 Cell division protein FtsA [Chlorobiota bacterium]MBW7853804.1 cell division protein FtsA [Candidatus Kapabacteria bacterium]MCC6330517.1 cell division protein FtsA [Ignavibacteria bacterium]